MNNVRHTVKANIITNIDKEMVELMFRNVERSTWHVERYEPQVAMFLLLHNISFTYEPDTGITFVAPSIYVQNIVVELRDVNGLYEPSIKKIKDSY